MILQSPTFLVEDPQRGYSRNDKIMSLIDVQKTIRSARKGILDKEYLPSAQNLILLKYLCSISAKHHVPAVFVSSPFMAEMQTDTSFSAAMLNLNKRISDIFADQPNCSWNGSQPLRHEMLSDLVHTNQTGAIIFTHEVADLLNRKIPRS